MACYPADENLDQNDKEVVNEFEWLDIKQLLNYN